MLDLATIPAESQGAHYRDVKKRLWQPQIPKITLKIQELERKLEAANDEVARLRQEARDNAVAAQWRIAQLCKVVEGHPLEDEFMKAVRVERVPGPEDDGDLGERITMTVCQAAQIARRHFEGSIKTTRILRWRHILWYLLRTHTEMSLPEIAREAGSVDHSTVHTALKKMKDNMWKYEDRITTVEKMLGLDASAAI